MVLPFPKPRKEIRDPQQEQKCDKVKYHLLLNELIRFLRHLNQRMSHCRSRLLETSSRNPFRYIAHWQSVKLDPMLARGGQTTHGLEQSSPKNLEKSPARTAKWHRPPM